jgi:[ribosomal protein S18]-alanine N-acetyltransferase
MDYTLRLAKRADAQDICDLDLELFPENCFNEGTLGREIEQGPCWVIYEGDTLAGYALCKLSGTLVDILRLGVREEYRQHGFGTLLLRQAMAVSGHIMLCVKVENDPALRLYQKHGFEIVGVLPQYDTWVMRFRRTASG